MLWMLLRCPRQALRKWGYSGTHRGSHFLWDVFVRSFGILFLFLGGWRKKQGTQEGRILKAAREEGRKEGRNRAWSMCASARNVTTLRSPHHVRNSKDWFKIPTYSPTGIWKMWSRKPKMDLEDVNLKPLSTIVCSNNLSHRQPLPQTTLQQATLSPTTFYTNSFLPKQPFTPTILYANSFWPQQAATLTTSKATSRLWWWNQLLSNTLQRH